MACCQPRAEICRIGDSPFAGANPPLGLILPAGRNSESTCWVIVPAVHNGDRFLRQRKNLLTSCFLCLILVSRPIHQALALDTLESSCRPFPIGNAKARTIVIAELKFRQIVLQVLFAAERIGPAHAVLEHAKPPGFRNPACPARSLPLKYAGAADTV